MTKYEVAQVTKLTKPIIQSLSLDTLKVLAECPDLDKRERRTVEAELADRPMRAYVLTGGIGAAPRS